ncbi:hypothetical protein, partial [Pseudoalteromonas sp. BSi20495]|uniref:hypothetical protein n=1 Tax=Pseudoalteromonas sp. BSi20495 TaxID=386429 RepID=UPI000518655D
PLCLLSIAENCYTGIKTRYSDQFLHVIHTFAKKHKDYKNKINKSVLFDYPIVPEKVVSTLHQRDEYFIKVKLSEQETVSLLLKNKDALTHQFTLQQVLESIVHAIGEKTSYYGSKDAVIPKSSFILNSELPILMYYIKSFNYTINNNMIVIDRIALAKPRDVYNKELDYFHDNKDGCKTLNETAQNINKLGFI